MNKKIIFYILLIILLIISISQIHATNTSDTDNKHIITNDDAEDSNVISKTNIKNKNIKTSSVEITSLNSLDEELNAKDEYKTINLKKDTYKLNNPITFLEKNFKKTRIINGNGATIDGLNSSSFLRINPNNEITINNLIIKNTRGLSEAGGIVLSDRSNLTLNNCKFINVVSEGKGGALINRGNTLIKNCEFRLNTAYHGGVIWSTGEYGGSLRIENSKFIGNKANHMSNYEKTAEIYLVSGGRVNIINNTFQQGDGASIHNYGTILTVKQNKFKNIILNFSEVTLRGAIIDNYEAPATVTENTFDNIKINVDKIRGGIFFNEAGKSTFNNNQVTNLKITTKAPADSLNGGIIFNRNSTMTVKNNKLSSTNKAIRVHGGAIYNNVGIMTLTSNTFNIVNTASEEIRGGAVYNDQDGNFYGIIYSSANNFKSIINTGKVNGEKIFSNGQIYEINQGKKSTKITLNKVTGEIDDTVTFKATIKDNMGKPVTKGNVIFKVNDKAVTIKTNKNGVFSYKYKTTQFGNNILKVSYVTNNEYMASNAESIFFISKRGTKLTVNNIESKTINEKVLITGKLIDSSGKAVKNNIIEVQINNNTKATKTNTYGIYKYNFTPDKLGSYNVTVRFAGYGKYKVSSVKTKFNIVKTSKITVNTIAKKTYGDKVTVTGKLTGSGIILKNTNVNIKINSKTISVKTNSKGIYTYTTKANTLGTNNVTVTFAGNNKYKRANIQIKFTVVKKAT